MPKTIISVDPKKAPWEQETPLHNRWHPDIPPVASVKEGESFRVSGYLYATFSFRTSANESFDVIRSSMQVECVDWTGGQIKNDDSSDDVKNVDLSQVHYLSGPVEIEGAKPGMFSL